MRLPKFPKSRTFIIIVVLFIVAMLLFYAVSYLFNSFGEVGTRGRDMVRPFPYFGIEFEIDYMPGQHPNQASLDRFQSFAEEHSRKLVSFTLTEIPSRASDPPLLRLGVYSIEEIVIITLEERNVIPLPGYISVYILYVDQSVESPEVGGASWCATCIVVAKPQIDTIGADLATELEQVVLAHEWLHLVGLMCVNYSTSANAYCDGNGHSTHDGSLMEAAPDWRTNPDVRNLRLYSEELNDLEGLRSGRL